MKNLIPTLVLGLSLMGCNNTSETATDLRKELNLQKEKELVALLQDASKNFIGTDGGDLTKNGDTGVIYRTLHELDDSNPADKGYNIIMGSNNKSTGEKITTELIGGDSLAVQYTFETQDPEGEKYFQTLYLRDKGVDGFEFRGSGTISRTMESGGGSTSIKVSKKRDFFKGKDYDEYWDALDKPLDRAISILSTEK